MSAVQPLGKRRALYQAVSKREYSSFVACTISPRTLTRMSSAISATMQPSTSGCSGVIFSAPSRAKSMERRLLTYLRFVTSSLLGTLATPYAVLAITASGITSLPNWPTTTMLLPWRLTKAPAYWLANGLSNQTWLPTLRRNTVIPGLFLSTSTAQAGP